MKLKYYLRGLGIGIVVTALIMHFALGGEKETMTDEEIKARAAQLGMVESTLLSELAQNNDASVSDNEAASQNAVPEAEAEAVQEPEVEPEVELEPEIVPEAEVVQEPETEQEPEVTQEPEEEPEVEDEPESNQEIDDETPSVATEGTYITVYGGDGSDTVARRLAEAGVVSSAAEYDAYLCANGYDVRICTGEHFIPAGATYEEIADILTSRQ